MSPRLAMSVARLLPAFLLAFTLATRAEDPPRGAEIFQLRCQVCHQPEGGGVPGVFPPLAKSDWIAKNREQAIRALCEGLTGRIRVNGADFDNAMPAQALNDRDAAEVLNFVGRSWGNEVPPFTADEIKTVRAKTRFPTYEVLVRASEYQPLPRPPAGYSVREVARMPEGEFGTRLAGDGKGPIAYVLTQTGNIWRLDSSAGTLEKVISATDYLKPSRGGISALGLMLAPDGVLWISTNQEIKRGKEYPLNETCIHRTPPISTDGKVGKPTTWFTHSYPHGGGFTHGVSHLAFGPDGLLYMSSGSRTDGNEKPPNHPDSPAGEVDTTACVWRFDPRAKEPAIEIFARGIRNPYGFAWDDQGRLFSVTNGPDANAAEEMDCLEKGRHYGFPYQFADWPVAPGKPYPHTPPPPPGLEFTLPVKNDGPAAGKGLSTFDPHSSPAGMIWCGPDFPPPLGGTFLISRYGNLLGEGRTGIKEDCGFDVLSVRISGEAPGALHAKIETVLAPLGRPLDVLHHGPGRALILEYTRPINFKDSLGWLSGRIIELSAGAK
jgi:glucose/arabinose dehydrogenase/mono/diheme cytochrome c family protein